MNMKQITTLADLNNKTIVQVYDGYESYILRFSDNTYCVFKLEYDDVILTDEEPDLADQMHAGLISEEEYQKRKQEADKRHREWEEKLAYSKFLELQKRFKK